MRIRFFDLPSGLDEKTKEKSSNKMYDRRIAKSLHLKERKKQLLKGNYTHFTAPKSHIGGSNYPFGRPKHGFLALRTSILYAPNKHSAHSAQALWTNKASIVDEQNLLGGRSKYLKSAFPVSISRFSQKVHVSKTLLNPTSRKYIPDIPDKLKVCAQSPHPSHNSLKRGIMQGGCVKTKVSEGGNREHHLVLHTFLKQ